MPSLRAAVYNVHGFREARPVTVAEAISIERPDLLLVNEVGRGRHLRRFARTLGMHAESGLRLFRKNPNAVLFRSPWRVLERRVVLLSRRTRLLPRGLVLVRLGHAGVRLWVASVHLGLSDSERVEHAREITDLLGGLAGIVILGGDLNEDPQRPAAAWIAERMWDAFARAGRGPEETFPSIEPRARIDYLFVGEGVEVRSAWVGDGEVVRAASDHRPLFADLVVE